MNDRRRLSSRLRHAIRVLSMDAVQKAKSAIPEPRRVWLISSAPWRDFLLAKLGNPDRFNRDRFVLSNGHGSMLIYSLLHLSGYALPMSELENFRQLHSATPSSGVR